MTGLGAAGNVRNSMLGRPGQTTGRPPLSGKSQRATSMERNPVAMFLQDAGLAKYAAPLISSGFDDMDTLLDIENEHMREIGIPPGHIVKLKKKLREYAGPNAGPNASVSVSVPKKAPTASQPQPTSNMMTTVQMSWVHVKKLGTDKVGETFYKKFFLLVPESKELFPISVRARYRDWTSAEDEDENDLNNSPAMRKLWAKVIDAVGSAVAGLHDPNQLVPMLQQLGMRHFGYGLKTQFFQMAAKILIEVLSEGLGDTFTKEVEQAWVTVYSFMTATMISGFQTAENEAKAIQTKLSMISTSRTTSLHSPRSSADDLSQEDQRMPAVTDQISPVVFDQPSAYSSYVDQWPDTSLPTAPKFKEIEVEYQQIRVPTPSQNSFAGSLVEAATASLDKLPMLLSNLQRNGVDK